MGLSLDCEGYKRYCPQVFRHETQHLFATHAHLFCLYADGFLRFGLTRPHRVLRVLKRLSIVFLLPPAQPPYLSVHGP